jgi:hypothetical protein
LPREAISQQTLASANDDVVEFTTAPALAPSVSLGNRALSDISYGQDQLPSAIKGPSNAFSILNAQANGTGTQTFDQYVSQRQGRVAELVDTRRLPGHGPADSDGRAGGS